MNFFKTIITLIFMVFSFYGITQDILKGIVTDESNEAIPFADVYVKNQGGERTRANVKGEYLLRLVPGDYKLVFAATGFKNREVFAVVAEGENIKNVQLFPIDVKDLEEFEVAVKKRNIGREIILKVVDIKDKLDFNQFAHRSNVYIKAVEKIEQKSGDKKEKKGKKEDLKKEEIDDTDPYAAEKKAQQLALKAVNNMKLVEVQLERNYAPPNKVREIRNAYEERGGRNLLYFTTTAKSNFNFFKNILFLNDLNESPIPSPISTVGILSYKYKLVEKIEGGKRIVNKIQITPRSSATSTLEGFIWVEDSTWMVKKLDLTLNKGNLYQYDYFQIQQEFDTSSDSLCVLKRQEMIYGLKYKKTEHKCKTVVDYKDFDFSVRYPRKYFGNEVAVTTQEAYERDSTYWEKGRTTALSKEEQAYIHKRDSITDFYTRTEYLDSVDSVFNKITPLKVLWFGVDHRNRAKKNQWSITSMAGMVTPVYIAGPRVGPYFNYFKKWDNEKNIDIDGQLNVGVLNGDFKGEFFASHLYNPFKWSRIGINFDHDFDLIRSYDAFSQILLRDNFIETTKVGVEHFTEIVNGLYLKTEFDFTERRSLYGNTKFITWLDDALENSDPPEFNTYQALIGKFTLSYTPFQKYMREPKRKVLLGSKWPMFYLLWESGIPKLFGSDVNHNYLRIGARQTFKIGTIGTTTYHISSGKFLSSKVLREIDYKYHRRSDPLWFSNTLYSYQDLDTSLPTLNSYLETHFIHHFNGAIINKIPFMKKTRITTLVGGGYLWVPEHNWQHAEIFTGLERVFKISRRRLRIGIYGVLSDGNQIAPRPTYKVSFALLNRKNMKFDF